LTVESILDLSALEEEPIVNGISTAIAKSLAKQTKARFNKENTLKIRQEVDESFDNVF
jgi:hypothetical protein